MHCTIQEQNKNKCLDEVEILRMCMDVLDEYLAHHHGQQKIVLQTMVAALTHRIPLAMSPAVLSSFSRWTLGMREAEGRNLVDAYLDWHSGTVNPKEQSLGPFPLRLPFQEQRSQEQNWHP